MKYKRKPIIVEATQWFKHGDHPLVHRCAYDAIGDRKAVIVPADHPYGYVDTSDGIRSLVCSGTWVVVDSRGNIKYQYPLHHLSKSRCYATSN